ncbi:uncharacterized protein (DUF362 family) [Anaerobacterium chartisolvens]|uniref:Ferredoxin n=1 Tax=Anaerobacterium chartisolvens TaxID=1297424 RepID=A0A369AVL9_9FIRM|nr:DUF362 domain-containing protein [Anaerobacterium chartisolvens]RCX13241.1 uncharacterized protein (DUF362 family) [Anaerobacterium chartisolvens]
MSKVSVEKCPDYEMGNMYRALKKTFDNLGGVEKYIRPGMRVALKPNLVMKKRPAEAATTHPSVVQALSSIIKEQGAKAIIVESPGGLYTKNALKGVYSACGIEEAALKSGAELNYDTAEAEVKNPEGVILKNLILIKPLMDADLIINLPKLKTHGQMVYTGAVKNMFGAVAGARKAEYHFRISEYKRFADALIDIFLGAKPALNIMDAVTGMEGNGPTAGNARNIGLVIAGEDAFSLDFAALNIIGADPFAVPLIAQAAQRGLCPKSLGEIDIVGEQISTVRISDFDIPQIESLRDIQFFNNKLFKGIMSYIKPRPVFNYALCVGCAECARNCPARIITMKNSKPRLDLSKCIRCFCCQELCPAKAVEIKRSPLLKFLIKK